MGESTPLSCCFLLFVIFCAGFAVSVTLCYFTLESYDETRKEGPARAVVFTWFIISALGSFALGVLILTTFYFIIKGISEQVYEEAVTRIEARLQNEHITVAVDEE